MKKIRKSGKAAQGHIEMILSFTIFVGFVLAIFFFINPARHITLNYSELDKAEKKLMENLSVDYGFVSLTLNKEPNSGQICIAVIDPFTLTNKTFIVKDAFNTIRNSRAYQFTSGGGMFAAVQYMISFEKSSVSEKRYFRFYIGDFFNRYNLSNIGCDILQPNDYAFGVMGDDKAVLYENLYTLNKSYIENYRKLKTEIGMESDFDYVIFDKDKKQIFNESLYMHKIRNGNILSRDIPIKAIDKDARIIDLVLKIRIW